MTTGQDAERNDTERGDATPIEIPIDTTVTTPTDTTVGMAADAPIDTQVGSTIRNDQRDTETAPLHPASRPSVRYAGVVWGVILAIVSGLTLYVFSDRSRTIGVANWLSALNSASLTALTALTVGVVVLVLVVLSALRHAQRIR